MKCIYIILNTILIDDYIFNVMFLATSHAEFAGIRLRHKEDGNDVSNSDFQDSSPLVKVSFCI